MSDPFGLVPVSSVLSAVRWGWRRVNDKLERASEPRLTIHVADPADSAREPGLEWLHLVVRNDGGRRARETEPAREASARVVARGRSGTKALIWSNALEGRGPAGRIAVHRNAPEGVPLVLRSAHNGFIRAGIGLRPVQVRDNECYLTDNNFLTQGLAECILEAGDHVLEVTVQYGPAKLAPVTCFRLSVPPPDSPLRLHIAEIDC